MPPAYCLLRHLRFFRQRHTPPPAATLAADISDDAIRCRCHIATRSAAYVRCRCYARRRRAYIYTRVRGARSSAAAYTRKKKSARGVAARYAQRSAGSA